MIPITQNINFATCDGFSQITSQMFQTYLYLQNFNGVFSSLSRYTPLKGVYIYIQNRVER